MNKNSEILSLRESKQHETERAMELMEQVKKLQAELDAAIVEMKEAQRVGRLDYMEAENTARLNTELKQRIERAEAERDAARAELAHEKTAHNADMTVMREYARHERVERTLREQCQADARALAFFARGKGDTVEQLKQRDTLIAKYGGEP